MALTDQQMMDVRRHAGYALAGTTMVINANQDVVFVKFGMVEMSLYTRLTTLSAVEEAKVVSYLADLASLETAIPGASTNLDTEAASVWKWNKNEVSDRAALFDMWRRRMCAFLGLAPGPGLGNGGMRLVRG